MRALTIFFTSAAGIGLPGRNCSVPADVGNGAASGSPEQVGAHRKEAQMLLECAIGHEVAVQLEGGLAVADDFLGAGGRRADLGAELFQRGSLRSGARRGEPGSTSLARGSLLMA